MYRRNPDLSGVSERILLVDDDQCVLRLLNRYIFSFGLEADRAQNGKQALKLMNEQPYGVVITDMVMPIMNGMELLINIREHHPKTDVLVISGHTETHSFSDLVAAGAADFITKPFSLDELKAKLQRIFRERHLLENLQLAKEKEKQFFLSLVESLAISLEEKDPYTHGHSRRVTALSLKLAELTEGDVSDFELLSLCGMLHDIGKIGVPDKVLSKPGPLSASEYNIIKKHPERGAHILRPIESDARGSLIARIIKHHHEHFDGNGYPGGLVGEKIPLMSRIIAIADTFDAMTSDRPYRKGLSRHNALLEIRKNAGSQFDPALVEKFIVLMNEK
ncbi:MAG: response regulator [Desulfobulbaceae bacterium]|nr:response regulator [Desulfobulbaceae bacterium]HIJ79878.1 response regulator [Deltaproteobacteria bacterium]